MTLAFSLVGGSLFFILHAPIPWLLGPMTAGLIVSRLNIFKLYWPSQLRNTGLIAVGYMLGLSITRSTLLQITQQLPSMLIVTLIILLFSALIAKVVSKWTGIDYKTVLTGSIPGGLSQMVTLGEEIKGIDLTVVTFIQVSRLLCIIFIVPFLIFSPIYSDGFSGAGSDQSVQASAAQWSGLFPNIIIFFALALAVALIGKRIKLPTPFLLGPIIATAILSNMGMHGPQLPKLMINISQVLIGGYFGLMLKTDQLQNKYKIIGFALFNGIVLTSFCWGLSVLVELTHHETPITSFLSVAPGGMDQMGLIAKELHANLSIITGYQIFRIFFILFIVPPVLKWLFRRSMAREA
ncbi:AbrB family transcriptional regulator [Falsibacillus albus]|uniref:AbrB family transcriptional regulator n=2 Tax=Falsibacillus albus TaxID=2478915 RepID=A0A3L7JLV9_9BACI|nr:AbrB family transcriptional regulator [Falsibacillus albus]